MEKKISEESRIIVYIKWHEEYFTNLINWILCKWKQPQITYNYSANYKWILSTYIDNVGH